VHRDGTGLDSNVIGVTLSTIDITINPPAIVALTDPELFAVTADWNHAGDLIVYSALATADALAPELFTIHPDGSGLTQLTSVVSGGGGTAEPSFNQDGSAVVFVGYTSPSSAPELLSVDLAGGTVTPAFAKSTAAHHPRVRPHAGTTGTALRVVGLGDSVMETGAGESASIVDVFAAKLKSTGVAGSVAVDNLGDPSATSDSLRIALQSDGKTREAVAAADIVVVSVGGNDADPFATYPPGTCTTGGDAAQCLAAYAPHLEANLDAIATEIVALRGGKPTALRFMSPDYNPFVGWDQAPSASFGTDFYAQVAGAETAAACAVAERHGGQCADVFHLFNGPDGTADAATYLAADHAHPGRTGIEAVANLLADLGVRELGG
jgi:lysophospholipase L1-like esterase